MDFMFDDNLLTEEDEEEILDELDNKDNKKEKQLKDKKKELKKISEKEKLKEKSSELIEKEYPTFFKHVRINETILTLSIFFYEKSKFVN